MRIDMHQHYLPHSLADHADAWQALLHSGSRVQGYADVAATVAAMDAAGVDRCIWQGEYFVRQADCVERNQRVLQARQYNPERLFAFAVVQPDHPQALAELERCRSVGFVGVGELNPVAQRFSLHGAGFMRVVEYCVRWQWPLLLHVNEPVGDAYAGKVAVSLADIYGIARQYPELRLVLAHWGGGLWWYEQIPQVRRVLANVYYDSAATFHTYPDSERLVRMALEIIPHKILFGSDFPLKRVTQVQPDVRAYVDLFMHVGTPEQQRACLGATAEALIWPQHVGALPRLDVQPPAPVLSLATPIMALYQRYPAVVTVAVAWGIQVDAQTPWWQSVDLAASAAGIRPDQKPELLADMARVIALYGT
jgi:predicted TIM-barrel fold metal-dependent hydrolase